MTSISGKTIQSFPVAQKTKQFNHCIFINSERNEIVRWEFSKNNCYVQYPILEQTNTNVTDEKDSMEDGT